MAQAASLAQSNTNFMVCSHGTVLRNHSSGLIAEDVIRHNQGITKEILVWETPLSIPMSICWLCSGNTAGKRKNLKDSPKPNIRIICICRHLKYQGSLLKKCFQLYMHNKNHVEYNRTSHWDIFSQFLCTSCCKKNTKKLHTGASSSEHCLNFTWSRIVAPGHKYIWQKINVFCVC